MTSLATICGPFQEPKVTNSQASQKNQTQAQPKEDKKLLGLISQVKELLPDLGK
jgi:hypothetical protein